MKCILFCFPLSMLELLNCRHAESTDQALHFVKQAEDATPQEQSHVAPDVRYEAVEVVDDVLLLVDVRGVVH